jgi:hypothetical protein
MVAKEVLFLFVTGRDQRLELTHHLIEEDQRDQFIHIFKVLY